MARAPLGGDAWGEYNRPFSFDLTSGCLAHFWVSKKEATAGSSGCYDANKTDRGSAVQVTIQAGKLTGSASSTATAPCAEVLWAARS